MRRSDEGREQDAISFANLGKAHNTRFTHGASLSLAKAGPMSGAFMPSGAAHEQGLHALGCSP
jgi:hypothetical protein